MVAMFSGTFFWEGHPGVIIVSWLLGSSPRKPAWCDRLAPSGPCSGEICRLKNKHSHISLHICMYRKWKKPNTAPVDGVHHFFHRFPIPNNNEIVHLGQVWVKNQYGMWTFQHVTDSVDLLGDEGTRVTQTCVKKSKIRWFVIPITRVVVDVWIGHRGYKPTNTSGARLSRSLNRPWNIFHSWTSLMFLLKGDFAPCHVCFLHSGFWVGLIPILNWPGAWHLWISLTGYTESTMYSANFPHDIAV